MHRNQRVVQDRTRGRVVSVRVRQWTGLALAIVAIGGVAVGCGSQESHVANDRADARGVISVPVHETSRQAQTAGFEPAVSGQNELGANTSVESPTLAEPGQVTMPPDIIVTASSTTVSPGEVIEIVVQTTPDVTELSLWDGINDRQALAYDADAKAWRVSYRVPLKLPWERTGLAITAHNEGQRWCRSWVFIQNAAAMAAGDTSLSGAPALAGDVAEPEEK